MDVGHGAMSILIRVYSPTNTTLISCQFINCPSPTPSPTPLLLLLLRALASSLLPLLRTLALLLVSLLLLRYPPRMMMPPAQEEALGLGTEALPAPPPATGCGASMQTAEEAAPGYDACCKCTFKMF